MAGSGAEIALAAAAALALAATLSGCSTFGVAPFPEPIRPPIEAEGEDTPAPEAQAEEASRYSVFWRGRVSCRHPVQQLIKARGPVASTKG